MIEIRRVNKAFGRNKVLNDLNLSVRDGETKAIIGRSGVGKSVMLHCIVGLLRPDSGSIRVDGRELTLLSEKDYDEVRREIGFVFQGGALFDSMSVADNVGFVLKEFKLAGPEKIRRRVEWCLENVGLPGIGHLRPASLSGGMRKRVGIARALSTEPKFIFYDEPTSQVDPITADTLNTLIMELRNKLGVTSILVTHDMVSAYKVADSVAMLYHGRIIADGTADEIRNSEHPVVQQFINGEAVGPITDDERLIFEHRG